MAGPLLVSTAVEEDQREQESQSLSARRARYGLIFFAFYLVLYGAFVLLNAFAPGLMEITLGGVNLAVLFGLVLIGAAFVLALLYDWLCRVLAARDGAEGIGSEGERGQ
jgi:uncharacterized membrane protein (DUF485 family)